MSVSAQPQIVVIGGGKMGEAIVGGLIQAKEGVAAELGADQFSVAEPKSERRLELEERYGIHCVGDGSEVSTADVLILAVKPQVMMGVLEDLSQHAAYLKKDKAPLIISIAAGLSTAVLEAALPDKSPLVRVMPNTPLLVSQGVSAITGGKWASEEDVQYALALFSCLGYAVVVEESYMDVIGAISGSGPAYVAALIEALVAAGKNEGLDAALAERLAVQTIAGTAQLMKETGTSATETRKAVCSPGGTTLAALAAMEDGGFSQSIAAGVTAAVLRSKELGAC